MQIIAWRAFQLLILYFQQYFRRRTHRAPVSNCRKQGRKGSWELFLRWWEYMYELSGKLYGFSIRFVVYERKKLTWLMCSLNYAEFWGLSKYYFSLPRWMMFFYDYCSFLMTFSLQWIFFFWYLWSVENIWGIYLLKYVSFFFF